MLVIVSGCGFSPGIWCEGEVQGETWESKWEAAWENCAPVVRFTLPSHVDRWAIEGDE